MLPKAVRHTIGRYWKAPWCHIWFSLQLSLQFNLHSLSDFYIFPSSPPHGRKGPFLPVYGLKYPWRVKREATNSRFHLSGGLRIFFRFFPNFFGSFSSKTGSRNLKNKESGRLQCSQIDLMEDSTFQGGGIPALDKHINFD